MPELKEISRDDMATPRYRRALLFADYILNMATDFVPYVSRRQLKEHLMEISYRQNLEIMPIPDAWDAMTTQQIAMEMIKAHPVMVLAGEGLLSKPIIVPVNQAGDENTGRLPSNITPAQIAKVLGFKANIDDDGTKVKHSWGFTVDGKRAGIWDYKGLRWSIFDPDGVIPALFADVIGAGK